MTEKERQAYITLFGLVFCHIRSLAWNGNYTQAGDLADAFHNIPNAVNSGNCSIEFLKRELESYVQKFGMVLDEGGVKFDYVKFLENK